MADDDPAVLGMPAGGHDGLAEHLAALDDGASLVAPGNCDEAEPLVGGSDVHDVDEVRGIAPGGEPLHRDIALLVPVVLVGDLDHDPVLVEGDVVREPRLAVRRAQVIGQALARPRTWSSAAGK